MSHGDAESLDCGKVMQPNEIGQPSPSVKKNFWSQRLASITLSLVMFIVGLGNGWSSPYLAKLTLKEGIDGIPRLNDEELSWVASLMNMGRIFGAISGAVAQDTVGRKMSLCLSGVPMMCGWICIAVAVSVHWLYAGRILCGISMGMVWTTLSLYLAEIADPEIRGSLASRQFSPRQRALIANVDYCPERSGSLVEDKRRKFCRDHDRSVCC